MTDENHSLTEVLPNLVVLLMLLFLEYSITMTLGPSLALVGDNGVFIGIPFVLALVLIILIVFGLYSICGKSTKYKMISNITLILFIIQVVLIFIMYLFFAIAV